MPRHVKHAPNSHIQLEGQLQRIVAASNLALGAVNRSSLSDDPDIDRRLVEWLSSDEPHNCFHVEGNGEVAKGILVTAILQEHPFCIQGDKIKEAIMLFNTHRPNFHFLLTMDIW
jgi:hypothetical protein